MVGDFFHSFFASSRHSSIKSIAKESEEKSKIALDLLPNEVVVQKSDDRTDYAPYLTPG